MKARRQPWVRQFVPFLTWLPELKNPQILRADVIAGITVALVLIPQSMAYAQLANLPAYYGLYAAFLPPLVAALFGSSRQLATGPVAVVSLMTATALAPIVSADSSTYLAYAVLLALLVGLFQFALGLLRMGILINFLSHPVVLGFTNAAALIIATSQLSKIFGVQLERITGEAHYETVWRTIQAAVTDTHIPTLLIATLAFVIILSVRRMWPRLPNVLIAVVITTILAWAIGFQRSVQIDLEQIASPNVTITIAKQKALAEQIPQLRTLVKNAEKAWDELTPDADHFSQQATEALSKLRGLERALGEIQNLNKSYLRDLNNFRLSAVAQEGDTGRLVFYDADEVPAELSVASTGWKIDKMLDGDRLQLFAGGHVVGEIPRGLPSFSVPAFDWAIISELLVVVIGISLIGFLEAISIAKAMAAKTRQRLDANQELVGQGLANIAGSLFQSYPTSGSFSRSAVNIGAGAVTGFSSVVTSSMVVITLLALTPLLYQLPQATLAAVIMVTVIGLVNIRAVHHAWLANRHDGIVSVVTLVLTLALAPHLELGIIVGIGLSLVMYLWRTMTPRIVSLSRYSDGTFRDQKAFALQSCEEIAMIRYEGSLYFANSSYLEDKVEAILASKPKLQYMILDCAGISEVDATGEEIMRRLYQRLEDAGVELIFTRIHKPIFDTLTATGFVKWVGEERFTRRPDKALEDIYAKLGEEHAESCPLRHPMPVETTPPAPSPPAQPPTQDDNTGTEPKEPATSS